jgi:glutaconyl-CoA/methylmalonyl-CoA decarboxylase subunit delta
MIETAHITIAIVGYIIVFLVLLLLFIVFSNLPRLLKFRVRSLMKRKGEDCDRCDEYISAEVATAISATLYLYFNEAHDVESTKMTIKKVNKVYSPWSSKIHGISALKR